MNVLILLTSAAGAELLSDTGSDIDSDWSEALVMQCLCASVGPYCSAADFKAVTSAEQ